MLSVIHPAVVVAASDGQTGTAGLIVLAATSTIAQRIAALILVLTHGGRIQQKRKLSLTVMMKKREIQLWRVEVKKVYSYFASIGAYTYRPISDKAIQQIHVKIIILKFEVEIS